MEEDWVSLHTLDAGKTDGKCFLSELFFLGSEMDFQQKTVLESFCSLEKSSRSGLNKTSLLVNIWCGWISVSEAVQFLFSFFDDTLHFSQLLPALDTSSLPEHRPDFFPTGFPWESLHASPHHQYCLKVLTWALQGWVSVPCGSVTAALWLPQCSPSAVQGL